MACEVVCGETCDLGCHIACTELGAGEASLAVLAGAALA